MTYLLGICSIDKDDKTPAVAIKYDCWQQVFCLPCLVFNIAACNDTGINKYANHYCSPVWSVKGWSRRSPFIVCISTIRHSRCKPQPWMIGATTVLPGRVMSFASGICLNLDLIFVPQFHCFGKITFYRKTDGKTGLSFFLYIGFDEPWPSEYWWPHEPQIAIIFLYYWHYLKSTFGKCFKISSLCSKTLISCITKSSF